MSDVKKNQIPKELDPEYQLQTFAKGKMELATSIKSEGKDVTELHYDFTALTGRELMEALDKGANGFGTNTFRITNAQAMMLFAYAAAKQTEGNRRDGHRGAYGRGR